MNLLKLWVFSAPCNILLTCHLSSNVIYGSSLLFPPDAIFPLHSDFAMMQLTLLSQKGMVMWKRESSLRRVLLFMENVNRKGREDKAWEQSFYNYTV